MKEKNHPFSFCYQLQPCIGILQKEKRKKKILIVNFFLQNLAKVQEFRLKQKSAAIRWHYCKYDTIFYGALEVFFFFFFFPPILWCKWNGDHPEEDLAKFGYRSAKKLDFFWKTPYKLATWRTRGLNVALSTPFSLQIWRLWGEFFPKIFPWKFQPPFFQFVAKWPNLIELSLKLN